MDIFELINITSNKDLKIFLKNNSIEYSRHFGQINFITNFYGIDFVVYACSNTSIISYRIVMDKEKYDYNMMVQNMLTIKEELITILGKPKLDNTNHLDYKNIFIAFEHGALSLSVSCHNFQEYGSVPYAAIFLCNKKKDSKQAQNTRISSILVLWIPSLIGGFLWGLAMFGSMGAKYGYNLVNFGIWMFGGLLFGVAFGLLFGLWNRFSGKTPKYGNKNIEKIIDSYSLQNEKDLVKGNVFTYVCTTSHSTKQRVDSALLKLTDIDITIYSLVRKHQIVLKMPIREAYYHILNSSLTFNRGNALYRFSFSDSTKNKEFENLLFNKLINLEEYSSLFNQLKDATIAYNPYQIYNSSNQNELDEYIDIITTALLIKPDIKNSELNQLIFNTFDYDRYYAISLTDLYFEVYSKFRIQNRLQIIVPK